MKVCFALKMGKVQTLEAEGKIPSSKESWKVFCWQDNEEGAGDSKSQHAVLEEGVGDI